MKKTISKLLALALTAAEAQGKRQTEEKTPDQQKMAAGNRPETARLPRVTSPIW